MGYVLRKPKETDMSKNEDTVSSTELYGRDRRGVADPVRLVKATAAPQPYLLPFKHAIKALGLEGDVPERFEVTREQLDAFVATLLRGLEFDEASYLDRYPDIKKAVSLGESTSAKDHFVKHGYREGRYAARAEVDAQWYLRTYQDIAEGVKAGAIRSAQEHFDTYGRDEGRLPYDG